MIVLADLPVNEVTSYHTEPHIKDIDVKVKRITSTEGYKKLRANIIKEGFLHPVLAMCTPTRECMVEIGEQRLLIAREIGAETLKGIIYDKGAYIKVPYLRRLWDLLEFDQEAPSIKTLNRYLKAGIACL